MNRTMWRLNLDGKEFATFETEQQAYAWIHRNHSFSVSHALKYEGYSLEQFEKVMPESEIIERLMHLPWQYRQLAQVRKSLAEAREYLNRVRAPGAIEYTRNHNFANAIEHFQHATRTLARMEDDIEQFEKAVEIERQRPR